MKTLTIRGIDPLLSEAIKIQAQKNNESINKTALKILREAVGLSDNPVYKTYHDLDNLAGTWSEEDEIEFKKNIQDFEKIDKEMWD